ncbi:MAG: hypothetical protein IPM98_04860 [Lewinellaceae bacterium]|nr:hypothetical protein [Lewinellaceae bacterium]
MYRFVFFACCLFAACQSPFPNAEFAPLTVRFPIELHEQPDEKSRGLLRLPAGSTLADRNETSRFLASVYLDDTLFQEPWLRVQTPDGRQGWVFAGAVVPADGSAADVARWLQGKRAEALFGAAVARRLWDWAETEVPATDTAFAGYLRAGLHLRDTLNQLLAHAVSRDAAQAPPELGWLDGPMRYFWIQSSPVPRLYLDFHRVGQVAARTAGRQDDQFAGIGLAAYPLDSIESNLPAWVFPLSVEESCSNLGAGYHLALLQKIETALQASTAFQPELLHWKDLILADMLDKSRVYWQPRDKILTELDQVFSAPLSCLSGRDRLALEARRAMFVAGEVRMDLRSGR